MLYIYISYDCTISYMQIVCSNRNTNKQYESLFFILIMVQFRVNGNLQAIMIYIYI